MSLEVMVAFAGYYFARKGSLQTAPEEIQMGWNGIESSVPSYDYEDESYEIYLATFGRIVLKVRTYEGSLGKTEKELLSLTIVPKDPPPFELALRALANDIAKRKMTISLKHAPKLDNDRGYTIKFNHRGRTMEAVICHGSLQMLTLYEKLPE